MDVEMNSSTEEDSITHNDHDNRNVETPVTVTDDNQARREELYDVDTVYVGFSWRNYLTSAFYTPSPPKYGMGHGKIIPEYSESRLLTGREGKSPGTPIGLSSFDTIHPSELLQYSHPELYAAELRERYEDDGSLQSDQNSHNQEMKEVKKSDRNTYYSRGGN